MEMNFESVPGRIALWLILASSIALHEWGHAYAADRRGDPLPRLQGRVTLNPLAHIDLVGTVFIPLFMLLAAPGFAILGWGKPVEVSLPNPKTRKWDDMIITACGPLVNLLIALGCAVVGGVLAGVQSPYAEVCQVAIIMNIALFVFNLIPIPPLDGSHFLKYAVRMSDETYAMLARWGFVILLILINIPQFKALMRVIMGLVAIPVFWIGQVIAGWI